ncbi:hypothetical protein D5018_07225 [Parashewanella curva]|uniref:Uncharacterized protein n=1 Tax=Parashewanella curva TaxID=2338552 RepID=A0A3L8PZ62_9GAMM|nr:hypothetical protein D5018_07225 [Parashewanella curva]
MTMCCASCFSVGGAYQNGFEESTKVERCLNISTCGCYQCCPKKERIFTLKNFSTKSQLKHSQALGIEIFITNEEVKIRIV